MYGFNFEEHKVTTEDGYILTLYRIYGKLNESEEEKKQKYKKSVLLVHGLLDSSFTFLAMNEQQSLPFILANNGFDVWLGNNRGTLFSHEHKDKDKDSNDMGSEYWDFTFNELAKYDVVSMIDFVKTTSQREKISYVCHSQGCFQFLLGYTMNPSFFENSIDKYGTMGNVLKISQMVLFY
jgi:lysosomal acid lipase/cholesteryl ester hydrolase